MKYIVDRFEGEFAVLEKEDGGTIDVPKSEVMGANEGDVVLYENGVYRVDTDETEKRKALIKKKMESLFKKK